MIAKIGKGAARSKAGKLALNQAAINTRTEAFRKLGFKSLKEFETSRLKKGSSRVGCNVWCRCYGCCISRHSNTGYIPRCKRG